ncbi:ABC transporter ATP-binding protein [Kineococcus radiotolerans]|uniref:ABC transporter-related protein n=1 Tax=Kineococcus radiotolerans (strain ATCC BAA-149 / DSM 14245 / SRS30216) TaxID=266940 RepID=A6WH28_KINRD|nr:ATP-binding cassette domain-containing protein [Kineococcus radiotolerans]ABS06117.1 ABC transporter-related protein [Kineococcus radiotolerans SRS30216 = ATCC BAA-149]
MLEVQDLRKTYRGGKVAVDGVSFVARPGQVTGFLGPNGAGKTTTMRAIAGLERPTSGRVLVDGRPFAEHAAPMSTLGVLLEAKAVHPGRSVRRHLQALAATCGIPPHQVDDVLHLVGLAESADTRIRGLSLGMGQRVGLATALLGNPSTVMLDEPLNGLDPEGVRWMRHLMRTLAAQGRTVFVSSHLLSEMAQTADHLIVIGRGRLIADESLDAFLARVETVGLTVYSPDVEHLAALLRRLAGEASARGEQVDITEDADGRFHVEGLSAELIGEAAVEARLRVHQLSPVRASLEEAFMQLTSSDVQYRSTTLTLEGGATPTLTGAGR